VLSGRPAPAINVSPAIARVEFEPAGSCSVHTIDPSANFKGDFIAYLERIADAWALKRPERRALLGGLRAARSRLPAALRAALAVALRASRSK